MNRRELFTGLLLLGLPIGFQNAAAESIRKWELLAAKRLKPDSQSLRVLIGKKPIEISEFKIGAAVNGLWVYNAILRHDSKRREFITINRNLPPGREIAVSNPNRELPVESLNLEYVNLPFGSAKTLVRIWAA